jgi:hypothetical protein
MLYSFTITSLILTNPVLKKIHVMSNMLFNQALLLSSYKNENFLRTILNSFYHIAKTERNVTHKIRQYVGRSTEFNGAIVTFELQTTQQINFQRFYPTFLKQAENYT